MKPSLVSADPIRSLIPRHPVESRTIAEVGYDRATSTLAIQFVARPGEEVGPVYHYANVTEDMFVDLRQADSVGGFFYKFIKADRETYPFTKIEPAPRAKNEERAA